MTRAAQRNMDTDITYSIYKHSRLYLFLYKENRCLAPNGYDMRGV